MAADDVTTCGCGTRKALADNNVGGTYVLRYKWEGGGLFGGRSLHLIGLAR